MINLSSSQSQARQCVILDSAAQRLFRLRKGILTASRLVNDRLKSAIDCKGRRQRWAPVMVTLTYAPDVKWKPAHITEYVNRVQMYARRKGGKIPYCWVMELQKSGKPHYHCIFWIPVRWLLPRSDVRGWWEHGSTNTVRAHNAYGYLSKYASKCQGPKSTEGGYVHQFPRGARIHGIGGLTSDEAAIVAWWKLPKVLRRGAEGSHKWRRYPGGGWICIDGEACGEIYDSGWGLSSINMVDKRVRLVEKPSVIYDLMPGDLVGMWRDRIEIEARLECQAAIRRLEAYRSSWQWKGGARGYEHPDDAPSLVLLPPSNPLGKYHALPVPF